MKNKSNIKGYWKGAITALFLFWHSALLAQNQAPAIGNEKMFYAETKQVNQFFRRFNNEESASGEKYYPEDEGYRNLQNRSRYLSILFDQNNTAITKELKQLFISDVNNKYKPQFLEFHGGKWFAEASCSVTYRGKIEKATLYLNVQEEKIGSKWVLVYVKFAPFQAYFKKSKEDLVHFMHPMSHELDFMPLYKALTVNTGYAENYTNKEYYPDYLTLFIYELKKGGITFRSIDKVKFHFFQLNNWYFQLEQFNRTSNNSGYLISKLLKVSEKEKQDLVKKIYNGEVF